jgi:hypothetical protein
MTLDQIIITVQDTFYIDGRCLVVAPSVPLDIYSGLREIMVELKAPNGSARTAILSLGLPFLDPPPNQPEYIGVFRDLKKPDVPIGTVILLPSKAIGH